MSSKRAATIDVWASPDCDTAYSISLCEADGSEIKCLGGDDDADNAFSSAVELSEDHYGGLPVRLLRRSGEVTREWSPEA
jgi:hypothetical protein